jgi:hypothetical protein
MKDLLDGKIVKNLTFRQILLLLSGLAIISGTFLTWLTYNNLGQLENLTGFDLYQKYAELPEISILPLIGATLFIGTLIISQLPELVTTSRYPKYVAAFLSLLALIISAETTFRLQTLITNQIGIGFLNNTGCGWYLTIGGAIISLTAMVIPHKKEKKQ